MPQETLSDLMHLCSDNAHVAPNAPEVELRVSERGGAFGVEPMMIHRRKRPLPEGAGGIFKQRGKAAEIAEEVVRDLHAKIGGRATKAQDRQVMQGKIGNNHPSLSVGTPGRLLSMSRSLLCREPAEHLAADAPQAADADRSEARQQEARKGCCPGNIVIERL